MKENTKQMFVIWIWIYCDMDMDLFLDYIASVLLYLAV